MYVLDIYKSVLLIRSPDSCRYRQDPSPVQNQRTQRSRPNRLIRLTITPQSVSPSPIICCPLGFGEMSEDERDSDSRSAEEGEDDDTFQPAFVLPVPPPFLPSSSEFLFFILYYYYIFSFEAIRRECRPPPSPPLRRGSSVFLDLFSVPSPIPLPLPSSLSCVFLRSYNSYYNNYINMRY